MAPLDALSGQEMIPCEIDGKNYKITPDQIAPFVDIANIPTFDSITGQEKVIVVRDGKAQGLVTLTQIRQVVLPGYTYEDLSMSKFPEYPGAINPEGLLYTELGYSHIEIPVPEKNSVFVIKCVSAISTIRRFAFIKKTTFPEGILEYCDGTGPYSMNIGETVTLIAPEDAAFVFLNVTHNRGEIKWSVQVGELIITTRLNELENRVNTLEQSPSPANIDGVSREEFDALRAEMEKMKSQMSPSVVGKETM